MPDPYDGSMREQLIVEIAPDAPLGVDKERLPQGGNTIYIDAHDWASRVTEVALSAQGAHDHFERMEAVRNYEPPSMVWETTMVQSEADNEPTAEIDDGKPEEDDE